MLRVVIDTNVFVAGYLSKDIKGCPPQIISMWRAGAFTLVMSPQILREVVAKMLEKGIDEQLVEEFVAVVGKIALRIPGAYETRKLDKIDPGDNMFLAASYEAKADFIVSYDSKSLLPMKHFHGAQIVSPRLFMRAMFRVTESQKQSRLPIADD